MSFLTFHAAWSYKLQTKWQSQLVSWELFSYCHINYDCTLKFWLKAKREILSSSQTILGIARFCPWNQKISFFFLFINCEAIRDQQFLFNQYNLSKYGASADISHMTIAQFNNWWYVTPQIVIRSNHEKALTMNASIATIRYHSRGSSNEQISSDIHQISLYHQQSLPTSGGYREVQCIMGNGHMVTFCEQTDRHEWKHYLPATFLAGSKNNGIFCEFSHFTVVDAINIPAHRF